MTVKDFLETEISGNVRKVRFFLGDSDITNCSHIEKLIVIDAAFASNGDVYAHVILP